MRHSWKRNTWFERSINVFFSPSQTFFYTFNKRVFVTVNKRFEVTFGKWFFNVHQSFWNMFADRTEHIHATFQKHHQSIYNLFVKMFFFNVFAMFSQHNNLLLLHSSPPVPSFILICIHVCLYSTTCLLGLHTLTLTKAWGGA